jgi:hypothetical protein
MISSRARAAFDQMLAASLRSSFPGGHAAAGFGPVEDFAQVTERRAVMLSVAACRFRLMLFLHFDTDARARALLAQLRGLPPDAGADQGFLDAMSEYGNLCCGTLNRELGRVFACLGMSTPNIVERESLRHLPLLRPGYLRHYRLDLGGEHRFHATLCVCEKGELDFEPPPAAPAAEAAGELELF